MNELYDKIEILSVREFTEKLKFLVQNEFQDVWIQGEISNFIDHTSGHAYFSLKDQDAFLKAAFFKFNRKKVKFVLEDGLQVKAHGYVSIYDRRGEYQLIVDFLEPEGMGALQLAFLQLKERLEKEGLFDPGLKKTIPPFPERVGIITSPTGAAIRDILNVMSRRFSSVDIMLYPTQVQGDGAAEDIAKSIVLANNMGLADVLIVGRGGGSAEDLWAFNEEAVAHAIFNSVIPVISAVGHEIDYTIADFAADLRVPTPSAAAEIVVANKETLVEELANLDIRMNQALNYMIDTQKEKLNRFNEDILSRLFSQQLNQHRITLDYLSQSLLTETSKCLEAASSRFSVLHEKLLALGPSSILKRGYSLVYLRQDEKKKLIKNANDLQDNDFLEIQFSQGHINAQVKKAHDDIKLNA